jgi:hypothetical protein
MLMMPERESTKQDEVTADFQDGFKLEQIEKCADTIEFNNDALLDLVKMTPNYWYIAPETWERLTTIDHFKTQIEFLILIFHRSHKEI